MRLLLSFISVFCFLLSTFGQVTNLATGQNIGTTTNLSNVVAGGGGGGPDTYYYGVGSDDYPNEGVFATTYYMGDDITCTSAGTITKMGTKLVAGTFNIKLVLWYNNGGTWTFHECVERASTSGWADVTLTTPKTVSAGEVVRVMFVANTSSQEYTYKGTSGGFFDTRAYASGCSTTQPTWNNDYQLSVRVYVD